MSKQGINEHFQYVEICVRRQTSAPTKTTEYHT